MFVCPLAAHGLEFTRPVTFLVGANDSEKPTFVEAIAERFKLDSHGGQTLAEEEKFSHRARFNCAQRAS